MNKGNHFLCRLFLFSLCLLAATNFPIMGNANTFTGAIGDFVWDDLNHNGIQETGELGIDNVTVNLLNSVDVIIATASTGPGGFYQFTGLAPGDYSLSILTLPTDYIFTLQNIGSDSTDSDFDSSGVA